MTAVLRSGVFTVLFFLMTVLLNDDAVWTSVVGALVAGSLFTLLLWIYERRAPDAASTE